MGLSLVIRNGIVYDCLGNAPQRVDVGIDGERIVAIGSIPEHQVEQAAQVIDATGLSVSPGFINTLSHAWGALQLEGDGKSDLLQGVTTEVFGEAFSLGPSNDVFKQFADDYGIEPEIKVDFPRLSDGLSWLEKNGVSMNVASFLGGHNLRILGAGMDNRRMTAAEIDMLRAVVDEEMAEGALGIGTALIYAPGNYTDTDELVAMCEPVGKHDGLYISHMRSEGDQFLECLEELITIGQRAECRTEVYHLKAAGAHNHHKMAQAIERIEQARSAGQAVSANMYPYTAGGTALAASIPPEFHAGGIPALIARVRDPHERARIREALGKRSDAFENLFLGANEGQGIFFFSNISDGTPTAGKWLPEVGELLGISNPADALLEVVARDSTVGVAYFMMSEDNVQLGLSQPWVSIGSDAPAHACDGPESELPTHPRTYGTFARVLGHYRREVGLFTLEEAVRKMTSLPAQTFRLKDRGQLTPGAFADIAIFDADTINDVATFDDSHRYSVGMRHVVVNGQLAVLDGEATTARSGRRLQRGR